MKFNKWLFIYFILGIGAGLGIGAAMNNTGMGIALGFGIFGVCITFDAAFGLSDSVPSAQCEDK